MSTSLKFLYIYEEVSAIMKFQEFLKLQFPDHEGAVDVWYNVIVYNIIVIVYHFHTSIACCRFFLIEKWIGP